MKDRALLLDPEKILPSSLEDFLHQLDLDVESFEVEGEFSSKVFSTPYQVVIYAFQTGDPARLELIQQIRQRSKVFSPILVIGPDSVPIAVNALQNGANHYSALPLNLSDLEEIFKSNKLFAERPQAGYQREETLVQIIKEIALVMELDRLSNILMDSAMELTDADGGALLLLNEKSNALIPKAVRGLSGNENETEYFGMQEARYMEILNSRRPEFLQAVRIDGGGEEKMSEMMVAPIWAKNEPLGVLVNTKYSDSSRPFSKDDFKLLTLLIEEISGAVYNAVTHYRTKELTIKDDLTEAYNRRYFEHYLEEELMRARRYGSNLSLIFFDVDNLKEVNMQYGHLIGSKSLQEVAHRMILTVRGIDKVVRYGGDEFCVVLPETDTQGAFQVAERIRTTVGGQPFLINETLEISITGSMGIASFPIHASGKEELIRQADKAMFVIKNKTKNAIAVAETLAQ
jgi:two-component system, cell cycle response regulator